MNSLIIYDCDSTLSSIEGVDELGRLKGEEVRRQVEDLTNQAMGGFIELENVFEKRMELIRPTQHELNQISKLYQETLAPGAQEVIDQLKEDGWLQAVVSGGLFPPVKHLASYLGISEVMAVPVEFDVSGNYVGFQADYYTARSGGKPECVRLLKERYDVDYTVMVGDGVSDLETQSEVDLFVGFGAFVEREKVREQSDEFIRSFAELPDILAKRRAKA
ncbi:MAG: HAD-IB family phosphatase [Verrucomicrobiota bacterium]